MIGSAGWSLTGSGGALRAPALIMNQPYYEAASGEDGGGNGGGGGQIFPERESSILHAHRDHIPRKGNLTLRHLKDH